MILGDTFIKLKQVLVAMRTILTIILFFFAAFSANSSYAVISEDSLTVSLLTCSPGKDLYSMFGHSGIRVRNHTTGEDVVFNYGMFNYNADNFIYRFIKGETDYELGAEYAYGFFRRYRADGHSVVEQVLDFSDEEKRLLLDLLLENYRPENRVYRYNFLYDNCTTRARDIIEKTIELGNGKIIYTDKEWREETFRAVLHRFTSSYPWAEFGIDMLLGAEVDKTATFTEWMFIPSQYKLLVDNGCIVAFDGLTTRHLLHGTFDVVSADATVSDTLLITPNVVFTVLLLVVVGVCIFDIRRRRLFWWLDIVLMTTQGLAGVLISFLFFFSEHPAVGSNWLVWVFNPLPLLALVPIVKSLLNMRKNWLITANMSALSLFVVAMPFLPQYFGAAMVLLVLTLQLRALCCWYVVGRCV